MARTNGQMNGQVNTPWMLKPKGFPGGLHVHKRGWSMRIKGRESVIAGKIPPQDALAVFYQKMAAQTTQQDTPKTTQQTHEFSLETPPAPAPLPVLAKPSLTVEQLKDMYLAHKTLEWRGGEFAPRSLMSIKEVLPKFAAACPKAVGDLAVKDFADYRAKLAAKYKPNSLNRHVINIRAMFAWAYRNHYIPDLPKWGDSFCPWCARMRPRARMARGSTTLPCGFAICSSGQSS